MTKPLIAVMNGINLNMLGRRDPAQYGVMELETINQRVAELAGDLGLTVEFFQSNHEGAFVEKIHALHGGGAAGLLINAGAWTHYSYGIRDALELLTIPVVEGHLSHVQGREEFRRVSVLSSVTSGVVAGFGANSYLLALRAVAGLIGTCG